MRTIAGTDWSVDEARAYIRKWTQEVPWCGCWLWEGGVVHDPKGFGGYGRHRIPGTTKRMLAHRTAYEAYVGQLPAHMHVMHTCDVPACCNPDHLRIGTHADNMADKVAKGRQQRGESSGRAKLTESLVREIRSSTEDAASLARRLGVAKSTVVHARTRRTWKHLQ